jgi:hypothetical protein
VKSPGEINKKKIEVGFHKIFVVTLAFFLWGVCYERLLDVCIHLNEKWDFLGTVQFGVFSHFFFFN